MRSVRCLLFDFDGTLCDTSTLHEQAFLQALTTHGYGAIQLTEGFHTKKTLAKVSALARRGLVADAHVDSIVATKHAVSLQLAADVYVDDAIVELLRTLHLSHMLGIVSDCSPRLIDVIVGQRGAAGVFDVIVANDGSVPQKPSPVLYEAAIRRLGVQPTNCAAFEDTETGVSAAHAAGIATVVRTAFTTLYDDIVRNTSER